MSCSRSEVPTGATIGARAYCGYAIQLDPLPSYPRHRGRRRRRPRCPTRRRTGRWGVARCSGCSASASPACCGARRRSPGWRRCSGPIALNDRTGLTGLLPATGRFRIYTVTGNLPKRSDAEYRLTVDGSVDRPAVLDLADSATACRRPSLTRDFQCVTGWRVADVPWEGVKLADLLDEVGVRPSATHVRFWSFDGVYTETLTLDQARRDDVLVAHRMQGKPSPASTAARCASTWLPCTATSRSSGSTASRSSMPSTTPPTPATGSTTATTSTPGWAVERPQTTHPT